MTLHIAVELGDAPLAEAGERAEAAGAAFVTLDDSPLYSGRPRIEAGVRAAWLARRAARVGIAPTLPVTTTEPFHLATQLASLDHVSRGRAGWVVAAPNTAAALATVGRTPIEPNALRQEVADVIGVARGLWDSWEDGAVIRDVASGRFLDRDKVHHVDFEGATFSIAGPLITPRPPQGQVVVIGADTLGVTELLDVALIAAPTLAEVERRASAARSAGAPLVFADLVAAGSLGADEPLLERLDGIVDGVRMRLGDPAGGRDLHRTSTLREVLGLPRPVNRFAAV